MKRCLTICLLIALLAGTCFAGASPHDTAVPKPTDTYADSVVTIGAIENMQAESAILIDLESGTVLYEQDADLVLPPASITKIMTLLLVIEAVERGELAYSDTVTAGEHACSMGGAQIYLKVGEQMTVEELFKAVSIASANDAAVALAEHVAGSEAAFVARMNERAQELGMNHTVFKNACGLDADGHVTTARDIAKMSAELCKHEKAFTYSTTWMDSVRNGEFELVNTNKLVRSYQGITGLKTGSTGKAKCCLSATAERNGIALCAVVMGCETGAIRFASAAALLDYGFATFERVDLIGDTKLPEVPVSFGEAEWVSAEFAECGSALIERGKSSEIVRELIWLPEPEAPIEKGDLLGTLIVRCDDTELAQIPIVAGSSVKRLGFGTIFSRLLASFRLF